HADRRLLLLPDVLQPELQRAELHDRRVVLQPLPGHELLRRQHLRDADHGQLQRLLGQPARGIGGARAMSATRRVAWLFGGLLALGMLASAPATAADCYQTAETCIEGPQTRDIGGYPAQRDCWRYRASYTCVSQNSTDDCQPLRDRGCS